VNKPVIRNASPYVGSEYDQLRKEDLADKKNWISQVNFRSNFGKATSSKPDYYIKNYVTADPSEPPMLHKFRKDDKDQWIAGNFKC